jgi:peptide/nickel transport system ATP-binding protein
VSAPILSVEGLTVRFGGRVVVDDVSFTVSAGEVAALVGESGSGKSVSALSVMRLLPDNARIAGRILLDGQDILALPESRMRALRGSLAGMIFQEPLTSLNPVLTVGFQLQEGLRYHRGLNHSAGRAEAKRLLDLVRIPDAASRLDAFPHTFSGGMRQRIMIAMALACRPKLLIADEPTTALDVTIQAGILTLLRDLQAETGTAVLFITHDMGVVAEIADRVIVMRSGKVLEDRKVGDVFATPAHDYTRTLLAAVPRLGDMRGIAVPATTTPTTKVLEVENLVTRFPVRGGVFGRPRAYVHAVEDVSFTLGRGETLALVGESGCGKSTTGRSIIRLSEPLSGSVRFEGQDVLRQPPAELRRLRRDIQMIFQDPFGSLDPRQTVASAIAEPIRVHGLAEGSEIMDRVAHLLRRVGLDPASGHRFPHEFSGGQRQRICIARALALGPRVIIADEAVSALDVSIKQQVVELLLDLQAELGLSYLFISHDMAVVERVSHRIAVMYMGEIVEIGPRAAVIEQPGHGYTQRLLAAVPIADPARRRPRAALAPAGDLPSPVRPVGFIPPPRAYRQIGPDHFIRV